MINLNSKIYVAGHKGLVGSAICRRLNYYGYKMYGGVTLDVNNAISITSFIIIT